jgi:hypothetical protein
MVKTATGEAIMSATIARDHFEKVNVLTFLQEPYPCEGCKLKQHCAKNNICCEDFNVYTSTGITQSRNRVPSKRWMRINATGDKAIKEEDEIEAMRFATTHGINIAVAATGIKPYRITRWLRELVNGKGKK